MTGWLCRPLHGLIWAIGLRKARQDDRNAQQAASNAAVFAAIGRGELFEPLPKRRS